MNERTELIREKGKRYYNIVSKRTGATEKIKYFIDTIERYSVEEIQEYLDSFTDTEVKFKASTEVDIFLMAFIEERTKKSQLKANKKWADENKAHANYLKNRSAARSFIRNKATQEDLIELKKLIEEKLTSEE